jgi:hypothetical protein
MTVAHPQSSTELVFERHRDARHDWFRMSLERRADLEAGRVSLGPAGRRVLERLSWPVGACA